MRENKLSIRIEARAEQFQQAIQKVTTDVKAAGATIRRSLADSGEGAASLARDVEDTAGSFGKVSKEADTVSAEVLAAFAKLEKSIRAAQDEVKDFRRELSESGNESSKLYKVNASLKEMEDNLGDAADAAKSIDLQGSLDNVEKLAQKIQAIGDLFLDVAASSRDMERAIKGAFSNPAEAEAMIKTAREIQDAYGDLVDPADIGLAVKRLDTLGASGEENLRRVTKAAIDAGKDVSDAADTIGEALAPLDSIGFDKEVFNGELRTNLGIGAQALKAYGAQLDSNNEILADNRSQQEAAQKALKAYLDENDRYRDISKRGKDAQAEVSDEFAKFARSVGDVVNDLKNAIAEAILPLIKYLNTLGPTAKTAVAGLALIAAPLGAAAVAAGQFVSVMKTFGLQVPNLTSGLNNAKDAATGLGGKVKDLLPRLKTFATGTGGSALALGGLAVAAYQTAKASDQYGESLEQVDKAESSLINTQAKARREHEHLNEVRKKSVESIREEAKALEDYTKQRILATFTLADAREALDDAERSGDKAAIESAKQRVAEAQSFRNEVDSFHAIELKQIAAAKKADEERYAAALDAFRTFQKTASRGEFDSDKAALSKLQSIASRLTGDTLKEAQGEIRKYQAKILQDELDGLNKRIAAQKLSAKDAQQIQAALLAKYQANTDQKKKAEEKLTETIAGELNKRYAQAEQYAQKDLDLQRSAVAQKAGLAKNNPELQSLERRLEKGEDVIAQIKAEEKAQVVKLQSYIDEEAALDRISLKRQELADIKADPANKDTIEEQAAERLRQLNVQVAADKAALDQELADKNRALDEKRAKLLEQQTKEREAQLKAEAEQASKTAALRLQVLEEERAGQEEVFQQRRRHLEELAAAGQDVSKQQQELALEEVDALQEAIKQKLELRKQEIEAQRAQENVGATAAQAELNAKKAALETDKAQREARKELQGIIDQDTDKLRTQTAELEKQKKILEDQNKERAKAAGFEINSSFGGVSGLENINTFGEGFGQRRQPKTEDGQSVEDIDRQIARNKVKLAENAEKSKRTDSAFGDGQAANPGSSTGLGAGPTDVNLPPQVIGLFQQMATNIAQGTQATNNLAQTIRAGQNQNRAPAHNAGAMFAEGGTRLPGNPR